MENSLIYHIVREIKSYNFKVLRIENNDRFLYRKDVIRSLENLGVRVCSGTSLELRVQYELRNPEDYLVLLNQDNRAFLPDILHKSFPLDWELSRCFPTLHAGSLLNLDLELLDRIYREDHVLFLNRATTEIEINRLSATLPNETNHVKPLQELSALLKASIADDPVNWTVVAKSLGELIKEAVLQRSLSEYKGLISEVNDAFQKDLEVNYKHIRNSNFIRKPQIVSKVLNYLHFNYKEAKIALIVIDGLAFWQYYLLKDRLSYQLNEEAIYSWIPSITQLSRQAIFKGENPVVHYRQNPPSEKKLWTDFWKNNGFASHQIKYLHGSPIDVSVLNASKVALVYKDLDDKMHSSDDYQDLSALTQNWITKSSLLNDIEQLLDYGFKVFITTDHGNIEARTWRSLAGREKLGTNESGSRSERHLEYSKSWLKEELLANNPELLNYIVADENAIYFKNDLSFSRRENLVTHGGAHILEVLIPFVKISK